jgi:hypothetical protein
MSKPAIKATLYYPGFDPVKGSYGELANRLFSWRMLIFLLLVQVIHSSFVPHGVSGDDMLMLSMKFWFVCSVIYIAVHMVAISVMRMIASFTRHFVYNQIIVAIFGTLVVNYTMVWGRDYMPFEYAVAERHIWLFILLNMARLFVFEALIFYFVLGDGVHIKFRDTRYIDLDGRAIRQKDILSVQAVGGSVEVRTNAEVYVAHTHVRDVTKQIDSSFGITIDPTVWISPNFVLGYRWENNRVVVILSDGAERVVGRAQQQASLEWLARHFICDMTAG